MDHDVYLPVSITAVTFLEFWKRKSASTSYHWNCFTLEAAEVGVGYVLSVFPVFR